MNKLVFSLAAILIASPVFAECGDDPRISDLPGIIASDSRPEKPFTFTPESFIRLQPAVRDMLGDDIVICPKNMVKDGSPLYPSRLPLAFNIIWDALEEAINMDDWANVKYIRDHAEAAILDPEAVFSLLVIPLISDADLEKIRSTISMDIGFLATDADVKEPYRPVFLADIFAAFGGKAKGNPTIVWSRNIDTLEEARAMAESREVKNHIFLPYSGYAIYRAKHAMAKFGISMIRASDFLRQ